jgi:hypothetical protein
MAVDTSMYQNIRLPDFVGAYTQGRDWRNKQDERLKLQQIDEAKKSMYAMGPDGKLALNPQGMQQLAQLAPEQAFQAQSQIDQQARQGMLDQRSQQNADRDYYLRMREIDAKRAEGPKLPLDRQKIVEGLATKNAGKSSIKNQLDAFMGSWDGLSEDQKIVQGRQLLKTLNSPEGADAIGAEEAKRLGGLLEYKIGNFTDPGSFIGRDLEEFGNQVRNTSRMLGDGISSNQDQIDMNMGRPQSSEQYMRNLERQHTAAKNKQSGGGFGMSEANAGQKKTFKTKDIEW